MERSPEPLRRSAARRWLPVLLACVCVFFAIRGWNKSLRPDGTDFTVYYEAGRAVLDGRDPMEVEYFIYLPVFAVVFAPLALLPYALASAVWELVLLASLLWCVRASLRLLPEDAGLGTRLLAWLPWAVTLRLADSNFAYGQVNLVTFALVLAGISAWRDGRARCGLWFGLAAAWKVLPAIFLVHLALRRQVRAVAIGALTLAGAVLLAPVPLIGWETNLRGLESWWIDVAGPYRAGGDELLEAWPYVPGQSLTAIGYRMLTAPGAEAGVAPEDRPNVLDLEPATVSILVRAGALLHLLAIVAVFARRRSPPGSRGWLLEVSGVLCLALILAPLVHKAHLVWLILPYTVLLFGLEEIAPRRRTLLIGLVALSMLLIAGTTPALLGGAGTDFVLRRCAIFFGLETAFLALLVAAPHSPSPRITSTRGSVISSIA